MTKKYRAFIFGLGFFSLLIFSNAEAKTKKYYPNSDEITRDEPLVQYAPSSSSPNTVYLGHPNYYYYYPNAAPYEYGPGYYAPRGGYYRGGPYRRGPRGFWHNNYNNYGPAYYPGSHGGAGGTVYLP